MIGTILTLILSLVMMAPCSGVKMNPDPGGHTVGGSGGTGMRNQGVHAQPAGNGGGRVIVSL